MCKLQIYFKTKTDEFFWKVILTTKEDYDLFVSFLSCFGDYEDETLLVPRKQRSTQELKTKVTAFVDLNSQSQPQLNRIKSGILNIPDDQFFFVFPEYPTETEERMKLEIYLNALNSTDDPNEATSIFENNFNDLLNQAGELIDNYDFHTLRNDRRTLIGNAEKSMRCCRFCKNTENENATFSKKAHAIPEALGNKNLILLDECDVCNAFFGDEIEPNLIEYLDFYRVFLGIKGKNGIPKITYKNGKISHRDGNTILEAENFDVSPKQVNFVFESPRKCTPLKLYKALCKISLSTIDENNLKSLKKTISWVRHGENDTIPVPKIARIIEPSAPSTAPEITHFIRKAADHNLPHIVSMFRIESLVFIFILPFSDADTLDFSNNANFDLFWSTFTPYNKKPGWSFIDANEAEEFTVVNIVHWNF